MSSEPQLRPPRRWPHVLIEDGPRCAGLGPGDMVPVEPGHLLQLGCAPWLPGTGDKPGEERTALHADTVERVWVENYPALRIVDDPPRVESTTNSMDPREWRPFKDQTITVDRYTLRFVFDGPVLGTVRRFGEHVVCYPRAKGVTRLGTCATSEWRIVSKHAHEILTVEELFDGVLRWETESAPMGRTTRWLREDFARARDPQKSDGPIDPEIAAGIAMQLKETDVGDFVVGYDGVVRGQYPTHGKRKERDGRAFAFLKLIHPWRWDWGTKRPIPDELEKARAALQTVAPASVEAIAAMMRAHFPEAAARAAAIVEECALIDPSSVASYER